MYFCLCLTAKLMQKFFKKFQTFFFGLSIGLVVACCFFLFKLDSFFKNIKLSSNDKNDKVIEETIKEEEQEKKDKKNSNNKKNLELKNYDYQGKSAKDSIKEQNKLLGIDTSYTPTSDGDILLLKEELQSIKHIKVKETGVTSANGKDSTLQKLSGVSEPSKSSFLMVEFWKTPLNSKGYKMMRNKVLLYGLSETPDLEVVKINDEYFLRNNALIYKLTYTNNFKPYERIFDDGIAKKFN